MRKLDVLICLILKLLSVSSIEVPYHGYIKELEILNYDTNTLQDKLNIYLDGRKINTDTFLTFTISTKIRDFDFCLQSKRHEHTFNLVQNYYFDGVLCSEPNIRAHGFIHEGVFFGRVEETQATEGRITYVFSNISYVKDKKERKKGHSVFYRSDQLDHEFLEKNIIRHKHPHVQKKEPETYTIQYMKSQTAYDYNDRIIENNSSVSGTLSRSELGGSQPKTKYVCTTHIDIHPSYVGSSRTVFAAVLEIITMFESLNKMYAENFNEKNEPLIQYTVASFRQLKDAALTSINSHLPSVRSTLDHYNRDSLFKNQYCAQVFLTHSNWQQTLGMAKVGNTDGVGICGRLAGTVITSYLMGDKLDVLSIENTIIHEFGHNLGANHDPATECEEKPCATEAELRRCSPGGQEGMFIMYYSANSGSFRNNAYFSPCSKDEIMALIKLPNRIKCFISSNDPICGNGVVEAGEQCDSGSEGDNCCDMTNKTIQQRCKLLANKTCSPSQGSCCTSECNLVSTDVSCVKATECESNSVCTGATAVCPVPQPVAEKTLCASNTKGCNGKGNCNMSLCQVAGKQDCDCDGNYQECVICCKNDGKATCSPLNFNGKPTIYKHKGDLCKGGKGLCTETHDCLKKIDDAGFSKFWTRLISGEMFTEAYNYIKVHWWVVALSGGGSLLLILFLTCIFKKDTADYLKKKYDEEQKKLTGQSKMVSQKDPQNFKSTNAPASSNSANLDSTRQNSNLSNVNYQNMNLMGSNKNFTPQPMYENSSNYYSSQQMVGPNQQMMMPNQQMMMPNQQMMGLNQQMMGSNQQMMGPNQQMMGPNQQMMGSNQQMMGTNQQMMGTNQQMMEPNQQMMEPNQQMMEPNQQMMGTNKQMMEPNTTQLKQANSMFNQGTVPQRVNYQNDLGAFSEQHLPNKKRRK